MTQLIPLPPDLPDRMAGWIRETVHRAGAKGCVLGLSGGLDSAVTAALCKRAPGCEVLGAILPCESLGRDEQDARLTASALDIETVTIALDEPFHALLGGIGELDDAARANVKPRLRMTTLYALAAQRSYLVAGTGNKSEIMVGYFTKYGDGGADLLPIGDLYKSRVRELARALAIPGEIVRKPPSAGLWAGQTDEEELGVTYEELDRALAGLASGETGGIEPALLRKVKKMVDSSAHKRARPPVFRFSGDSRAENRSL